MTENTTEPIRILIADDHAVVRTGLRVLIESASGMELVGEAADGVEAVLKARALQPDVIVLDIVMPRKDGIQATRQIKQEYPGARIIILTSFAEVERVFPAIKAGALGYLLKDSSPDDLVRAIRDVHRGQPYLHPTIALKVMREMNRQSDLPLAEAPLTKREMEVLRLVAQGLSNRDIADSLSIGTPTVGVYVSRILTKLHLANRTQAALYALREGLADIGEE